MYRGNNLPKMHFPNILMFLSDGHISSVLFIFFACFCEENAKGIYSQFSTSIPLSWVVCW